MGVLIVAGLALICWAFLNADDDSMPDPETGEPIPLAEWQTRMDHFRTEEGLAFIPWHSR